MAGWMDKTLILLVLFSAFLPINTRQKLKPGVSSCGALPWLHQCETNGYDKMTPPQMAINGNPWRPAPPRIAFPNVTAYCKIWPKCPRSIRPNDSTGTDRTGVFYVGETTPVQIQIYVESIGNFKAGSMDYDMDIYFVEYWRDLRLRHNHTDAMAFNSRNHLDRIWLPDLYFANSKTAQYNLVTVPNYVLKIQPNGTIRYSVRVHLKIACHMDLQAYPIDGQQCYLKIVTYGSTIDQVAVSWLTSEASIILDPEITESDLSLSGVSAQYCNGSYFELQFSCLLAVFYLKRNIGYSLLQTYLPTTFIVSISWISFWIDPSSVPGRVGLAVTTLLTLSTHAIGLHYQLPPVGYAKAQDVWFGACILFLFATLIEFALVNMYTRRCEHFSSRLRAGGWKKRSVWGYNRKGGMVRQTDTSNSVNGTTTMEHDEAVLLDEYIAECKKMAGRIDGCSRILFPCLFFMFCVVYWCVYLFVVNKKQVN